MSLKRKDIDVLLKINKNLISVKELSIATEISERNLRYIVENLNHYLEKILNKKIVKEKMKMSISLSQEEMDIFLNYVYNDIYVMEQEERIEDILLIFLFKDKVTLSSIERKLDITRGTLKKDIIQLNENIEKYQIKLELKNNYFMICGNEKKLRHLKMMKILEHFQINNLFIKERKTFDINHKKKSGIIFDWIEISNLAQIINTIDIVEKSLESKFEESFKEIMIFYLLVTLERINSKKFIERKNNQNYLITLPQYEIVKSSLKDLISEELTFELLHLTEYFISGSQSKNLQEERLNIELFTKDCLKKLSIILNTNFLKYDGLADEIIEYLIPAIYRMKNNFTLNLNLIKNKIYPHLKQIANADKYLSEKFRDEEILYISNLIQRYDEKYLDEKIDLNEILKIIEENSKNPSLDTIKEILLEKYNRFFR